MTPERRVAVTFHLDFRFVVFSDDESGLQMTPPDPPSVCHNLEEGTPTQSVRQKLSGPPLGTSDLCGRGGGRGQWRCHLERAPLMIAANGPPLTSRRVSFFPAAGVCG